MPSSNDYAISEGQVRLRKGSRLFGRAARILILEGASAEVEADLRTSFGHLRSAMNWLEDTNEFELAHQRLDAAGKLAREQFPKGCALVFSGGQYHQRCPVALAHNRSGMSPGYVVREAECSICHHDPEECDHITGRVYRGERCVRILKRLDLLEVSVVSRPAQPDARFTSTSVPVSTLRRKLGKDFSPGTTVICDHCLTPCQGVRRPFETGAADTTT